MQMMAMSNVRFVSLVAIGLLAGCTVSDASSSTTATASASPADAKDVCISGLSNFRHTAVVLTDACRNVKYETDRQAVAQAALVKGLEGYGAALPGGVTVDIRPMSLRMRCHSAGAAALQSYCEAEATVSLVAGGIDRGGQAISVSVSKGASERAQQGLICISTMPAVTSAVDKALMEAIADLQAGLTARTGISAPR
jgi:hypothetical protein